MKYSLKRYHWVVRELACFFFDHDWKWGNHQHTQYYGFDKENVPYTVRARSGNYMWETIASWEYKCRRCRRRLYNRVWPRHVWYKLVWWSLKQFVGSTRIALEVSLEGHTRGWKHWLTFIPSALLFGFDQAYACYWLIDRGWPEFPASLAFDLMNAMDKWAGRD